MSESARTIIELNIKHYQDLLKNEPDASKRQTIAKLLAEEEAKLGETATGQAARYVNCEVGQWGVRQSDQGRQCVGSTRTGFAVFASAHPTDVRRQAKTSA
jgi:hypothetical protein